ncbi:GNAT family N-acetyltransferase [Magnetospira thiophila]
MSDRRTIVTAGPAHTTVLAALHLAANGKVWRPEDLQSLLISPGLLSLVACRGEIPQAYVLCRAAADEAEILEIGTHPEARRQGHARALLHAVEARLAATGVRRLLLEVAADNGPAQALYEQAGFQLVGRRRGYYARPSGPAMDGLILERKIECS